MDGDEDEVQPKGIRDKIATAKVSYLNWDETDNIKEEVFTTKLFAIICILIRFSGRSTSKSGCGHGIRAYILTKEC